MPPCTHFAASSFRDPESRFYHPQSSYNHLFCSTGFNHPLTRILLYSSSFTRPPASAPREQLLKAQCAPAHPTPSLAATLSASSLPPHSHACAATPHAPASCTAQGSQ
eukprot:3941896-Rhodomonas_salina.3